MCVEYAQILSTTHRLSGSEASILYKATHINHPCTIWARRNSWNYMYLFLLYKNLCKEYTHRYHKHHLSETLSEALSEPPKDLNDKEWMTSPALAMPEKYHDSDPIKAYRTYYTGDKAHLLKYTNREFPEWV